VASSRGVNKPPSLRGALQHTLPRGTKISDLWFIAGIFVLFPSFLISLLFSLYGGWRGWGYRQYAVEVVLVTIGVVIGLFVLLSGWFTKAPKEKLLTIAVIVIGLFALLEVRLTLVHRSLSRRRS
jgi:hypothetical protein